MLAGPIPVSTHPLPRKEESRPGDGDDRNDRKPVVAATGKKSGTSDRFGTTVAVVPLSVNRPRSFISYFVRASAETVSEPIETRSAEFCSSL